MSKPKIGNIVLVSQETRSSYHWYYGKVVGFYESGLFVQSSDDTKPTCFSWDANEIKILAEGE